MRRRELLLALAATCAGFRAEAQTRLPTIALLVVGRPDGRSVPLLETLPPALEELGWVDGRTAKILAAEARGRIDDIPMVVEELVTQQVDVIVAGGAAVTAKALTVTRKVPIVMSASGLDPIGAGWAQSYARPGGNVTGLTLFNDELIGKQLELLKETAPNTSHVGLLSTRGNVAVESTILRARSAAAELGLRTSHGEITEPDEVEREIGALVALGADAVFAVTDPAMDNLRHRIADSCVRLRLPCTSQLWFYADAGFLLTYSADLPALHRRSAVFVNRILMGESPSEIPIERPSKFVLRVNAKTARVIGLEIPPSVLVRADEVIE
jgi:putative ABC transport system substrate-binding protein